MRHFFTVLAFGLAGAAFALATAALGQASSSEQLPRLGQPVTKHSIQSAQKAAVRDCPLSPEVAHERKQVGTPGDQRAVDHDSGDCSPQAFGNKGSTKAGLTTRSSLGVDRSNNNPVASSSWPSVRRAGVSYVWVKTSEGASYVDRYAVGMAAAARRAGLLVGGYHFAHVCMTSPSAEANLFLRQLHLAHLDTADSARPVLDVEYGGCSTGSGSRAWITSLYDHVAKATHLRIGVYSGNWWLAPHTDCLFSHLPKDTLSWISGYPSAVAPCGHGLDVHQFSDAYPTGPIRGDANRLSAASFDDLSAGSGRSVPVATAHAKKLCGEIKRIRSYVRSHGGHWSNHPKRKARAEEIKQALAKPRRVSGYSGQWRYGCHKAPIGCRREKV